MLSFVNEQLSSIENSDRTFDQKFYTYTCFILTPIIAIILIIYAINSAINYVKNKNKNKEKYNASFSAENVGNITTFVGNNWQCVLTLTVILVTLCFFSEIGEFFANRGFFHRNTPST